jgi:precorrin-6A/cobalt-precorrin-6A reductase
MDSQRRAAAVSPATASGRDRGRILILGGTAEARQLAARLAQRCDLAVTLSLAGRTASPAAQPVPLRIGGFGGAEGLARHLAQQRIDALIDATHPYAATMSAHAASAARAAGVPLMALRRPAWTAVAGDRWIEVADAPAAVAALGGAPRRVFLALGRRELRPFEAAPQHYYLVRSVDRVEPPLAVPSAAYVTGRGPFTEAGDHALLSAHRIEIVVAKNSGGSATYSKIAAARALGLTVVLLARPLLPEVPAVTTIDEIEAWIDHAVPRAERDV